MSFGVAYTAVKQGRRRTTSRGLIRDYTPEQEKKMMDDYYKRMRNWTPSNGRK